MSLDVPAVGGIRCEASVVPSMGCTASVTHLAPVDQCNAYIIYLTYTYRLALGRLFTGRQVN